MNKTIEEGLAMVIWRYGRPTLQGCSELSCIYHGEVLRLAREKGEPDGRNEASQDD